MWGSESLLGSEAANKSLLKEGLPKHEPPTEQGAPLCMLADTDNDRFSNLRQ